MSEKPTAVLAATGFNLPADAEGREPRPINDVAEECIMDGIAHLFYRVLSRVYEKKQTPVAAEVQWGHDRIDIYIQHESGWVGWSHRTPAIPVTGQGHGL